MAFQFCISQARSRSLSHQSAVHQVIRNKILTSRIDELTKARGRETRVTTSAEPESVKRRCSGGFIGREYLVKPGAVLEFTLIPLLSCRLQHCLLFGTEGMQHIEENQERGLHDNTLLGD